MSERDWKKEFASQLLNSNVEEDLTNATKLIKCHEKNLSVNGDFSCPGRKDIWQKVLKTNYCEDNEDLEAVAKSLVLDSAKPEVNLKIVQVNSKNEYLCFWLDRIAFMQNVFNAFDCMNLNRKNEVKVNDRITIQNTDKYQLTYLRCDQVAQFTERLMKCDSLMKQNAIQPFNLVITSNDKIENAIKIGPVLEKVNKKKSESTLLDVYKRFYKVFDTTSKERLVQSDAKRVVNVHTVTSAEIQFQLLSNNVGQPATIDENAEKVATFVLYNHARIVQIIHASKEISAKNQQCAENTTPNEPKEMDWGLLTEEEEWEIIYVYLSRYLEVLNDIIKVNDIKVGKIVQFLVGLSQSFSRYYNRVRIIREAPHLWKTVQARLHLLSVIRLVLEHGLYLLNVPCLGHM